MQVIVNSLPINYTIAGDGKVILLLHGWGDTMQTWVSLQSKLSLDYKVVALDLPGFGGSAAPERAWGLVDYAMFLKDFLEKLDITDVYTTIGHSNGGAIAIYAIGSHILDTKKLVLLASSGIRPKQTVKKQSLKIVAKTGKAIAKILPESQQLKLQAKLYSSLGSDVLVAPHMRKTFELIVGHDIQTEASHITIPTLLVYGGKDTATPSSYAEIIHRHIKNSELAIIPGVGHFIHHEASLVIENTIKDFLDV